jgi:hypothetical protein
LAGGVPGQGVVVEGVKGVKYGPMLPDMYENGEKTGNFLHFLANKSPKTPFFAQKYLTRYTPETSFEQYINFKIFRYFGHCGVIPVQSFGRHLRPQPPGLRLRAYKL